MATLGVGMAVRPAPTQISDSSFYYSGEPIVEYQLLHPIEE